MRTTWTWAAMAFSVVLTTSSSAYAQSSNPDDPSGKTLYITEPACGFFQCSVTWNKGSRVAVNWLGPPQGNIEVQLISTIGGPTYDIVNSIAGISQEGYCDSGYGHGVVAPGHECGRIEFIVPNGWQELVNYTIAVISKRDSSQIGYTDNITIAPAKSGESAPAGTDAELGTIPAPTSTNYDASVKFDGQLPAPTAVTGQGSSSSTSFASSSAILSSASRAAGGSLSQSSRNPSASSSASSAAVSVSGSSSGPAASGAAQSASPSSATSSSSVSLQRRGHEALLVGLGSSVCYMFLVSAL